MKKILLITATLFIGGCSLVKPYRIFISNGYKTTSVDCDSFTMVSQYYVVAYSNGSKFNLKSNEPIMVSSTK